MTELELWASSGAMALTGTAAGPPQLVAGAPATTVREAMLALEVLADANGLDPTRLPDHRLLGERAALMGLHRNGRSSAGGASRLIDTADGVIALTLSRPDDIAAVPALVERDVASDDPWRAVMKWAASRNSNEVVERATLLGLAIGAVDPSAEPNVIGPSRGLERPRRVGSARPIVVDLSSLWAGPLCAHLLGLMGAEVVHVESTRRPDPTRHVAPTFHRLLRGDREAVVLDFTNADEIARLRDLLLRADIVIEASRPRALEQLGIDAATIVAESGGCTWVSITAYGRAHNRIGYGDDVAAAAGLLGAGPVFASDAIADPLTGCHAAVAALTSWAAGASEIVDVAMYDVVRATRTAMPEAAVLRRDEEWFIDDGNLLIPVQAPAARQTTR